MKQFLYLIGLLIPALFYAQQTEKVDFKTAKTTLRIDPLQKEVKGDIDYKFLVLKNTDSIYIDARSMSFSKIILNKKEVRFYNDGQKLWLLDNFTAGKEYEISLSYTAKPQKAMYFIGWEFPDARKQVWTQGQGKNNSHWLPSFDDMNEKVEFDLTVIFDENYEVIANGKLISEKGVKNTKVWEYDMKQPMSSYLLAIAIGKYKKKSLLSAGGTPLEMYYYPEDENKAEPTYRHSKQMFDFLENKIGVDYPWQNYKQIPVKDFLYAGMENTTTTIFSDAYVIDSTAFEDKNYTNVNAHELAHQWFGDLVTEESGMHHWLQEGFATYYALLAEREIYGEDYFYWKLYQSSEELGELSRQGKGESLLDPKASSLTFYEKGAWALYMLHNRIGEKAFGKAVKNYLEKYRYKNVNTANFISEAEATSGQDLKDFYRIWLEQKEFPAAEAREALNQSSFVKSYLNLDCSEQGTDCGKLLEGPGYFPLKQLIVFNLKKKKSPNYLELYKKAFETGELKVRQAIAVSMDTIPAELKTEFESLLEDKSYITVENALLKLWLNFPNEKSRYLGLTKDKAGSNDKRLRILWLTLALITPEFESRSTPDFYKELSGYTSPSYAYEIRQNAFEFLYQIQALSNENLKDLINACRHPVWQFSRASRQLLDVLLKESVYRERIEQIFSELSTEDQTYIKDKLNK
ncbi:M1 family peptidase [Leptobacterium flavescens]|uniref:Aminopeptidase N n=1 Tax=Leptobacterium flavescens TaxID=472055 RepID=A0A6P0ULS6_9FLAO|nr:M1 family metallopeptidase [Leptobacterium flavescens]NER13360.1 M1 family peptidase [Leptobacterium flavescens]